MSKAVRTIPMFAGLYETPHVRMLPSEKPALKQERPAPECKNMTPAAPDGRSVWDCWKWHATPSTQEWLEIDTMGAAPPRSRGIDRHRPERKVGLRGAATRPQEAVGPPRKLEASGSHEDLKHGRPPVHLNATPAAPNGRSVSKSKV